MSSVSVITCDMGEDMVHPAAEVNLALSFSRNNLTSAEEDIQ
jgi:hypothetical protein